MDIAQELFNLQDNNYQELQSKIIPNISKEKVIGVRIPEIRKLAKKINDIDKKEFLETLPHTYYDENILHSVLLSEIKDYDELIKEINNFLPCIDNWAVCDTLLPRALKKHKQELIKEIIKWSKSKKTYTIRFGIGMLMRHFLDDDFKKEYLEIPASIKSNEYYVKMMISWFYATSLAKKWDETIVYLENSKLDLWVHNKTIQKAKESFRITNEQKEYLNSLKRSI